MHPNPTKESQWEWLKECLDENKQTLYGKKYNFNSIDSIEAYQKTVALVCYEDIQVYMDSISRGAKDILFAGLAVAYEMTSGSSGGSKLIPYTQKSFRDFQRAIVPYMQSLCTQKGINLKNSYFSISPAPIVKRKTDAGVAIGVSDAQYLGVTVEDDALMPSSVAEIQDMKSYKIATLYHLIVAKNLEFISIWSPTFFLVLLDALHTYHKELKKLLRDGDADGYERFLNYLRTNQTKELWSNLKLISLWQDGSSALYADELKTHFPNVCFESKGLLSTEGVVSVVDGSSPILCVDSGFYEFIDADGELFFAHQLVEMHRYEVVITTNGGLYRYKTKDIVICDGHKEFKPILRFHHRAGGVSDMVGEKITDNFVFEIFKNLGEFAILVPNPSSQDYTLVVQKGSSISKEDIEKNLSKNPHYHYARELGQLKELKILKIDNPLKLYMDDMLKDGMRLGDIKIPSLSLNNRWLK